MRTISRALHRTPVNTSSGEPILEAVRKPVFVSHRGHFRRYLWSPDLLLVTSLGDVIPELEGESADDRAASHLYRSDSAAADLVSATDPNDATWRRLQQICTSMGPARSSREISIRVTADADAPAIAELVTQLGYPAPAEVIPGRLAKMARTDDNIALVAEEDGKVVGVMTARIMWVIHHDAPLAWLTALVVLDSARGKGIGSTLLDRAEEWAKNKGAHKISLSSAMHRGDTHTYYDNRGYERSGLRFTKKFDGA
jgi:GNAT superfamily N-acetyltransferase